MMKKLVPPVVIALLFALFWFSGAYDYLNPAEIVDRKEQFQQAVNQNPFLAVLIFSMIYTSVVALSLPFASLLTMTAGFLFGLVTGTLIVVASATFGATIIFTVAKTSMGQVLKEKAGERLWPFFLSANPFWPTQNMTRGSRSKSSEKMGRTSIGCWCQPKKTTAFGSLQRHGMIFRCFRWWRGSRAGSRTPLSRWAR